MARETFVLVLLMAAMALGQVSIIAQQPSTFDEEACVEVSWSGATGDTSNDWVSSWWEPYAATYIQFFNVYNLPENRTCFSLLNARHRYFFRYYRGGQILATSNFVEPNGAYPVYPRLSLVEESHDKLRVTWTSNRTKGTSTVIQYGFDPQNLTHTAVASWDTFTHEDLYNLVGDGYIPILNESFPNIELRYLRCGTSAPTDAPCFTDRTASEQYVDPGYFHSAVMEKLPPASTVYYRVGEIGGPMSKVLYARTPHDPANPSTDSISVLMMADGGFGNANRGGFEGGALQNHHKSNGLDLVFAALQRQYKTTVPGNGQVFDDLFLFNGDLAYAQGWPYAWEWYHKLTSPVLSHIPLIAGYGNHEVDWAKNPFTDFEVRGSDSGGECGLVAKKRFQIPHPWYHRSYGPLTVVTLSSEHNITDQVAYLEEMLPTLNRTQTPWLVVQIHRPVYASSFKELLSYQIRGAYEDLFVRYNVDLVYTGHIHYYERLCAVNNEICNTYGFRDVWTNTGLVPDAQCLGYKKALQSLASCRATCALAAGKNRSSCVGVLYDYKTWECTHFTCLDNLQPLNASTYSVGQTMSVEPGQPPVYIIDGVAGAEPEPQWTPSSDKTKYKDFDDWGYSRLVVNRTHLHFLHYHMDGAVHDEQMFYKDFY